jgi:hypothetical protein
MIWTYYFIYTIFFFFSHVELFAVVVFLYHFFSYLANLSVFLSSSLRVGSGSHQNDRK